MAEAERFPDVVSHCRVGALDAAGHCLRASFSCPEHDCPEISALMGRLFAVAEPRTKTPIR